MINSTLPLAGHLPGHLRDRFAEAIEDRDDDEVQRAAGVVWSCTDVLPGDLCSMLDLPPGSSYAQAARVVRRDR
jgi:hypothetical protein